MQRLRSRPGQRRRPTDGRGGLVLIMTVLVLAVVALVGYAFSYAAGVSRRTALNARDGFRRGRAVESALQYALAMLQEDAEENGFDSLDELWAEPEHSIKIGGVTCVFRIRDEDRLLNVNRAARNPRDSRVYPDLRPALYRAVLQAGGGDQDYRALRQWVAGREPVLRASEVLQAPVVTPDLFVEGPDKPSLLRLLTSHPLRVNVNTAPREVLNSLWSDDQVTARLLKRREEQPFETREDLEAFLTMLDAPQLVRQLVPALDVASRYFMVRVRGSHPGMVTALTAFVRREETTVSVLYVSRAIEEEQS